MPSSFCAVIGSSCRESWSVALRSPRGRDLRSSSLLDLSASAPCAVREVPGAGEVHGDAGGLGTPRWSARRAPSRRAARSRRTPASIRICGPSSKGKNASEAATEPAARSPARETASRQESTRLTWPMPMPTEAPSLASRIALDFTARQAFQAKARSASTSGEAASPVARVQVVGSSPGGVDVVALLHQQAAGDRRGTRRRRGSGGRADQDPDVLLRGQHLDGAVVVGRAPRRPR